MRAADAIIFKGELSLGCVLYPIMFSRFAGLSAIILLQRGECVRDWDCSLCPEGESWETTLSQRVVAKISSRLSVVWVIALPWVQVRYSLVKR